MTTTTEAINSASWAEEDDEFVLASLLPLVLLLLLKFVSLTSLTLLVQNEKSESEREKLFWFSVPCWRWWWSCGRGSSGVESVCVCTMPHACSLLLAWLDEERKTDRLLRCLYILPPYHRTIGTTAACMQQKFILLLEFICHRLLGYTHNNFWVIIFPTTMTIIVSLLHSVNWKKILY